MKRQRGVTLVELMTVVAVIAILASLGYPMYLEQQMKGRRTDGKAMLHNVIQQLERYYTENNTFTDDLEELGFQPSGDLGAWVVYGHAGRQHEGPRRHRHQRDGHGDARGS